MKNIKITTLAIVLSLFTLSLFANNGNLLTVLQPDSTTYITDQKLSEIEKYISYMENENKLIGTVSISVENTEIYKRNFGQKNLPDGHAVTKDIPYQIGSISKMFTAVLLLKLEEKGEIDLNEPLGNYFPKMPNADKIKLYHMLNHTSGISDFVNKTDMDSEWLEKSQSVEKILEVIHQPDVEFAAGDSMTYSNSAYYLLAKIVEEKYGQSYDQVVAEQIVKPLKLKQTWGYSKAGNPNGITHSYEIEDGKWKEIKEFDFSNVIGVGDIVSTTTELNMFMNGLADGTLVKPVTLKKMMPKEGEWFGLSLMNVPFYDISSYGHGGATHGTFSVSSYNPGNKLAISYCINGEGFPTNDFAIGLLSIIHDKEFDYPVFGTQEISVENLKDFTGIYTTDMMPLEIAISIEDGQLLAQGTGQPAMPLNYVGDNKFTFDDAGATFVFNAADKQFVLMQSGMEIQFEMK